MKDQGSGQPPTPAEVSRRAVGVIQERLPPGWEIVASYDVAGRGSRRADAIVQLTAPDGLALRLVLEQKRVLVVRDLPLVLEALAADQGSMTGSSRPMIVAPYLSESVRRWLDSKDVAYADLTGNVRLVSREPAVFLRDRGADRDPWRGPGRPRGSLRGEPAARVVRALADYTPPMTATGLVQRSGASTGATYRVLDYLEEEALIERGPRGTINQVQWRTMLERWSRDYSFQHNTVAGYLQPRGLPALLAALGTASAVPRYAVTGSLAAALWAPYAPARLAMVYVDDVPGAAKELGLREVQSGANVLLAAPSSEVVFDRSRSIEGVTYAAASQVAVDLLTGPGRSPAEGQELLEWMETNEPVWRG